MFPVFTCPVNVSQCVNTTKMTQAANTRSCSVIVLMQKSSESALQSILESRETMKVPVSYPVLQIYQVPVRL